TGARRNRLRATVCQRRESGPDRGRKPRRPDTAEPSAERVRSPVGGSTASTARGAAPSSHRERRGARLARRDDREYREYLREEQRSQTGCIAVRMQRELHHGLLGPAQSPRELPHVQFVHLVLEGTKRNPQVLRGAG